MKYTSCFAARLLCFVRPLSSGCTTSSHWGPNSVMRVVMYFRLIPLNLRNTRYTQRVYRVDRTLANTALTSIHLATDCRHYCKLK